MRREWALSLARMWLRRRVARELDGLWVGGLDGARAHVAGGPVLFAANHVGWWDGPCLLLADDAVGGRGHFVLDAASLARFPFFAPLGAIPLDRSAPMRMRAGLRAAEAALDGPGATVWWFPQGRERPSWARPLALGRGHERLARRATVIPVAIAYAFAGSPRPRAYFQFGAPVAPDSLEAALIDGLAAIDAAIDDGPGFQPIVAPRGTRIDQGGGTALLRLVSRG